MCWRMVVGSRGSERQRGPAIVIRGPGVSVLFSQNPRHSVTDRVRRTFSIRRTDAMSSDPWHIRRLIDSRSSAAKFNAPKRPLLALEIPDFHSASGQGFWPILPYDIMWYACVIAAHVGDWLGPHARLSDWRGCIGELSGEFLGRL